MRGYRVEVSTDGGAWRSLCSRVGSYRLVDDSGTVVRELDPITDEGYVKSTSATSAEGDGKPLYVHEALARWTGWSLTVPRPGTTLEPQVREPPTARRLRAARRRRSSDATTEFRLETQLRAEAGDAAAPALRHQLPGARRLRRPRRRAAGAGRGGGARPQTRSSTAASSRCRRRRRSPCAPSGPASRSSGSSCAATTTATTPPTTSRRWAPERRNRAAIAAVTCSRRRPPSRWRSCTASSTSRSAPVAIPTPATGSRCASRGRSATRR